MKLRFLSILFILGVSNSVSAFDTEEASTDRFKVEYVEPDTVPPLTELPNYYAGKELAIKAEKEAIKRGESTKDQLIRRKESFRYASFPIRITDKETGNVYELQSDRRTIIAKRPSGEIIWTINPFKDANLKPYRVDYPFIYYFGKSNSDSNFKGPVLGIVFTGSQFGNIELISGKFHLGGAD